MTKKTIKMWIETARPKTLPLALATILTGSALAYWAGSFHWGITVLCLLTTLFLQILSNFANDYGDHQKAPTRQNVSDHYAAFNKAQFLLHS